MNHLVWNYTEHNYAPAAIREFEKEHQFSFPKAYKGMLKKSNGASPDKSKFTVDGEDFSIGYFLSWTPESELFICDAYKYMPENNKTLFPFAIDSFGNYVCFDFANGSENPQIVFWFHEQGSSTKIADDFSEFMNMLH